MALTIDDFLAHHGVKGMRWGVRKDDGRGVMAIGDLTVGSGVTAFSTVNDRRTPKYARAATRTMEKMRQTPLTPEERAKLNDINDKYKIADPSAKIQSDDAVYKRYREETRQLVDEHFQKLTPEGLSSRVLAGETDGDSRVLLLSTPEHLDTVTKLAVDAGARLKHAGTSNYKALKIVETLDSQGFTIDFKAVPTTIEHQAQAEDDFLAHYGVKGMRWGVRKQQSNVSKARKEARSAPKPASKDEALVKKAKSGDTSTMTNAELRAVVERINLNKQYAALQPVQLSKGQKFLESAQSGTKKFNEVIDFLNTPIGQGLTKTLDSMIKVDGEDSSAVSDLVAKLGGKSTSADKKAADEKQKKEEAFKDLEREVKTNVLQKQLERQKDEAFDAKVKEQEAWNNLDKSMSGKEVDDWLKKHL